MIGFLTDFAWASVLVIFEAELIKNDSETTCKELCSVFR